MARATVEAQLSGALPPDLVAELLDAYEELVSEFRLGHLRSAILSGGRFAEAAFRILQQEIEGQHTPIGQQLPNTETLLNALRNAAGTDRILKMDVPRLVDAVYAIRNHRDVGHIACDIDPNRMDTSLVLAVCSWVVAEFIRRYHGCPADEAQAIVDALVERQVPLVADMDGVLRVLDPKMAHKDRVLVILYSKADDWVSDSDLVSYTKYSNASKFRNEILPSLDAQLLIEYRNGDCCITPLGMKYVEENIHVQPF